MPLTVALPAATPVTVLPETVATEVFPDAKVPPVKPEGAEATLVPPTVMVVGARLTVLPEVGQGPGTTV